MKYKIGSFCFVAIKKKKSTPCVASLIHRDGKPWLAVCRPECGYMHIMHACMSNAAKSFSWSRKNPPSPCLSDMQRRLNSLMNSQVTRGLDYYSPTPPYTHTITHISNTHSLVHTLKLGGPPDPGDPHDSLMSQASAHV